MAKPKKKSALCVSSNIVHGQMSYPCDRGNSHDPWRRNWQRKSKIAINLGKRMLGIPDDHIFMNKNAVIISIDPVNGIALGLYKHDHWCWIIELRDEQVVLNMAYEFPELYPDCYQYDDNSNTLYLKEQL